MRLSVSTTLNVPPLQVWQEVQKSRLLRYVASPLVKFSPIMPYALPEVWENKDYLVQPRLWGVFPLNKQWIVISRPAAEDIGGEEDGTHYYLLDRGHGTLISRWEHLIWISETPDGKTKYTDVVELSAGVLTFFIWLFGQIFYRHRQHRWRRLAANGFDYQR